MFHMPALPPLTLADLIHYVTVCEHAHRVHHAQQLLSARPLRPEVEDYLFAFKEYVRELRKDEGAMLDRAACIAMRDRLRVRRGLTQEQAEQFPLADVLGAIRDSATPPASPPAVVEVKPAGPEPLPDWVGANFSPGPYAFLKVLWGRGEVSIAEVGLAVYEERYDNAEALDKIKDRINEKFLNLGIGLMVRRRRKVVYILTPE
jgi:hypothetical protein